MGTQGTGRKRSTKKERSTAEDDALNLIAREAEARLAAKRAARAEAREIRMKELERQQKELSDEDERMSVGSRGSVRVEDRDYLEKGSRAASALTATTLTSLGGSSSRRGSGETAITVDAETSLREIKDTLAEVEEKYRKAMVSNAQLDNEKNNLMYQVDTLKDSLMELEELLSESRREYEEKVKECEREKHAYSVLQFQFNEMKETLKQSEELLNEIRQLRMKQEGFVREISDLQETVEWKDKKIGALERQKEYTDAIRIERDELREEVVKLKDILKKHGIVLGPDLNINGDIGETPADGSPSEDPASLSTQDSQTPTEGNSMLGKTKETLLGSRGEEDVDLEQDQALHKEVKVNTLGCNSLEDNVKKMKTVGEDLGETSSQDSRGTYSPLEGQKYSHNDVDDLSNLSTCPQQNVTQDVLNKSFSESVPALANSEPQQEPEHTKKMENDKEEEKSQAQGAAASGKKKKKKRKGKKKAGTNEENQQKEKGNTEKGMQSATIDNGMINARFCCWPVTETLKELKGNQVKNKQDKQKNKDGSGVQVAKPAETVKNNENLKETQIDEVVNEHSKTQTSETQSSKDVQVMAPCETIEAPHEFRDYDDKNEQQSLEAEKVETVKATASIDTLPHVDTQEKFETEPNNGDVQDEQKLEEEMLEEPITSPAPQIIVCAIDTEETSSDAEVTEDAAKDSTSSVENIEIDTAEEKHVEDLTPETENLETENLEEVKEMQTCETIEAPEESPIHLGTDEMNEEQSLESENPAEAMAPSEAINKVDDPAESEMNPIKDEQDKEQTLDTSEAEEEESVVNHGSENSYSELEDSMNAESTQCPSKRCTSSEENSDVDFSTNSSVIHTESEVADSAESEVGSFNDVQSESNDKEDIDTDPLVSSLGEDNPDESETTNSPDSGSLVCSTSTDGLYDGQQSYSGSEQPSELLSEHADSCSDNTPIDFSERGSEEETETVIDITEQGSETEQESASPILDIDHSEITGGSDAEELNGDLKEPEGLVEPDSSSNDKIIEASDTESSPLETVDQTEQLDDVENQTSPPEDQTDEPHVDLSCEIEEINTGELLDASDSPKEGTEVSDVIKSDQNTEESVIEEDPEQAYCQIDEQIQTRHEPLKGESEDYQRSEVLTETTLLDSDDEDSVDEEGQSFDFDDLELDDAIASALPDDPKQISIVEGVEIPSKEGNRSLDLTQSSNDLSEYTQDKPEERDTAGGDHQIETQQRESDAISQDTLDSWAHGDTSSENLVEEQVNILEEVGVTEESAHVAEERKLLNAAELGEKHNQAISLPLEEGLDAVMEEDSVSLKSWDVVSSNTDSLPSGRHSKKGSKKSKGKGKEDCKMS